MAEEVSLTDSDQAGHNSFADVFSYLEDDMVKDPYLVEHLKHFGIDIAQMQKVYEFIIYPRKRQLIISFLLIVQKTEKTIAEMELDLQQSYDWNRIQEKGKDCILLYGPGRTGMANLGNSCYMSSVMQLLFSIPDFQKR